MNPIIKQRLVGTVVLLALGVVFWPIIFVEPEVSSPITLEPMPPRPGIDETPLPRPRLPQAVVDSDLAAPTVEPEVQSAADEATLLENDPDNAGAAVDDSLASLPNAREIDSLEPRSEPPQPVQRDKQGFARAWVLQVATVSSEERARQLVDALQGRGYEAFSRRFSLDDKVLWRVQIGPKLEQARLTAIKPDIDRSLKVNSTILRYVQ